MWWCLKYVQNCLCDIINLQWLGKQWIGTETILGLEMIIVIVFNLINYQFLQFFETRLLSGVNNDPNLRQIQV